MSQCGLVLHNIFFGFAILFYSTVVQSVAIDQLYYEIQFSWNNGFDNVLKIIIMLRIHNEPRSIIKQLSTVFGTWMRWRERWTSDEWMYGWFTVFLVFFPHILCVCWCFSVPKMNQCGDMFTFVSLIELHEDESLSRNSLSHEFADAFGFWKR